jgi:peroxiredoxin
MMKARYIIYSSVIFCLIFSGGCKSPAGPDDPTEAHVLQVGETAPNFTAEDQNYEYVSLHDYAGKVILFEFSADWCGPCRNEAPQLEVLYNEYKDRGFQVITLLISGSCKLWAETYNLTFPVLDDSHESVYIRYKEGGIPLNIVVDGNFVIRYKEAGFHEGEIRAIIEQYL